MQPKTVCLIHLWDTSYHALQIVKTRLVATLVTTHGTRHHALLFAETICNAATVTGAWCQIIVTASRLWQSWEWQEPRTRVLTCQQVSYLHRQPRCQQSALTPVNMEKCTNWDSLIPQTCQTMMIISRAIYLPQIYRRTCQDNRICQIKIQDWIFDKEYKLLYFI